MTEPDPIRSEPTPPDRPEPIEPEPIDLEPEAPAPIPPAPEPDLEDELPEPVEVRSASPRGEAAPASDALVKPGMGGARLPLGLGLVVLVGALIASGLRAGGTEGAGARFV
ncbi:MAG: hypothetical protein ACIARR_03660, partial [Phycisphaerales bacterium JB059]